MKLVRRGALPVGGESGLLDVRDRALAGRPEPPAESEGTIEAYDIWPAYVDRVLVVRRRRRRSSRSKS